MLGESLIELLSTPEDSIKGVEKCFQSMDGDLRDIVMIKEPF